jgi:hypothetical protein
MLEVQNFFGLDERWVREGVLVLITECDVLVVGPREHFPQVDERVLVLEHVGRRLFD